MSALDAKSHGAAPTTHAARFECLGRERNDARSASDPARVSGWAILLSAPLAALSRHRIV